MYIFDKVTATVEETKNPHNPIALVFDFYVGTQFFPFSDAKKVADPSFLSSQIAEVLDAYACEAVGTTVELTSDTSKIRGYQGGLCHFVINNGRRYLITPLRGRDAPSSPLMLDIQAGRLESVADGSWEDLLIRKGFEVGMYTDSARVVPQFSGSDFYSMHNTHVHETVEKGYARIALDTASSRPLVPSFVTILFDKNDTYAYVRVHRVDGVVGNYFRAAWAVLPYVSSIEFMQHVVHHVQGTVRYTDLQFDARAGKPVHRDIYAVDCETGKTQIWNAGNMTREDALAVLLQENNIALEEMLRAGTLRDGIVTPVSPKLHAAVDQLPSSFLRTYASSSRHRHAFADS